MRIIIFSDSLGRPRPEEELRQKTSYFDTYGFKLKKKLQYKHEVDIIYIESLDSEDAIFWSKRMVAYRVPDLVIFHLGINDCAPRIFKKGKRYFVFNPLIRKISFDFFLKLINKTRPFILKYLIRKRVYVDKNKFKNNFIELISDFKKFSPNCQFMCIGIGGATNEYKRKSPGIENNINEYNKILYDIFKNNFIDLNMILEKEPDKYLIKDNIHLTKRSHEKIYQFLNSKINY